MTISLFFPQHYFLRADISRGSSQESWGNTCTSAPERAARCSRKSSHRCLESGARTSLVIQHLGLPAVNPQSQALAGLHEKPTCGLLFPDWACHRQIKQGSDPLWKQSSISKKLFLFAVVPRGFMITCCQCDMGLPCLYFHQSILSAHFFAFCSSLNTGLCLMVFISNFQPVSSQYNLILPSDIIFNSVFLS